MQAKEAREVSQSVETGVHKTKYVNTKDKIKRAVNNGESYIIIYDELTRVVKKKLREEGYNIAVKNKNDMHKDTYTKVSWRRAR